MKLQDLRRKYAKPRAPPVQTPRKQPSSSKVGKAPSPQPGEDCPKCHSPGSLKTRLQRVTYDEVTVGPRKGKLIRNEEWVIYCSWTKGCRWWRRILPVEHGKLVVYPNPKGSGAKKAK